MYRGLAWRINSPNRRNHRATTNLLPYIRGILSHHPPSLLLSKHIILPVLERFLSRNDLTVNVHYILESVDEIVDHLNPLQDKLQPLSASWTSHFPAVWYQFGVNCRGRWLPPSSKAPRSALSARSSKSSPISHPPWFIAVFCQSSAINWGGVTVISAVCPTDGNCLSMTKLAIPQIGHKLHYQVRLVRLTERKIWNISHLSIYKLAVRVR